MKTHKPKKSNIVIVLDNIRSAHNVGAIFRTADAFVIDKIFLCGITAQPPNRNISKVALGATQSIEWQYNKNTIDIIQQLKKLNFFLLAIEQHKESTNLNNFHANPNDKYALILGNEINGVGEHISKLCHQKLEIPQFGIKKSLNVSVAAGIVIWHIFRKFY